MNIENIQREIYFEDEGMLRDIYVLNTTKNDWKQWVDVVNEKYAVDFYNGQTGKTESKINFETVLDVWTGKTDEPNEAIIKLGNLCIKCHFFIEEEIENDIDPIQIKTIEDHIILMDYLRTISKAINKRVILTPENVREVVLIAIDKEK